MFFRDAVYMLTRSLHNAERGRLPDVLHEFQSVQASQPGDQDAELSRLDGVGSCGHVSATRQRNRAVDQQPRYSVLRVWNHQVRKSQSGESTTGSGHGAHVPLRCRPAKGIHRYVDQ